MVFIAKQNYRPKHVVLLCYKYHHLAIFIVVFWLKFTPPYSLNTQWGWHTSELWRLYHVSTSDSPSLCAQPRLVGSRGLLRNVATGHPTRLLLPYKDLLLQELIMKQIECRGYSPDKILLAWKDPLWRKLILKQELYQILKRIGDRGSTVVKVLCYKSEGRWFDPR